MSNSMMSRQVRNKNIRASAGRSGGRGVNTKGTGSQNAQSNFEGLYANPRFSHVLATITGICVKIQVKNGNKYEGIFRTASSKGEFVLEMATKLNEDVSNHEVASSVPNREDIIEKLILKAQDIVSLSAEDVDLDYATKDSFATDAMISGNKVNGQVNERDLQPWQGDAQSEDLSLDSETSNGWDVNDMFRTNTQKFGVSSTYEENLSQYTTELEKKDTKEYKEREQEAERLAKEIESSPGHKVRQAKETEDGSEEDKFSAVHRPSNSGDSTMSANTVPGPGGSRYVPPPLRKQGGPYHQQYRRPPPQQGQQPYRNQHVHRDHHGLDTVQTNINGGVDRNDRKALDSGRNTPTSVAPPLAYHGRKLSDVVRGAPASAEVKPASQPPTSSISSNPAPPAAVPASVPTPAVVATAAVTPIQQQPQPAPPQPQQLPQSPPQQPQPQPQPQPPPPQQPDSGAAANPLEKKPNAKSRNDITEEFKKFSKDFSIREQKDMPESSGKPKETENENPKESKEVKPVETSVEQTASSSDVPKDSPSPKATSTNKDKETPKVDDVTKKSKLNPEAKEFKFNPQAKPFAPKAPMTKTPTPPRPQQPSPGVMAAPQQGMNLSHIAAMGQPVYAGMSQQYTVMTSTPMQVTMPAAPSSIVNPGIAQVQQQKQSGFPKRPPALMPQRPPQHHHEMSASHMMQASAATGPPIIAPVGYSQAQLMPYPAAQPHAQGTIMSQMIPQHVQYQPNIQYTQKPQMYRMITPQGQLTSPHHQGQHPFPQEIQTPATQVYVSPGSGMSQVPQPHPQAQHQHQPQPHPTQPQPQPHLHHPHSQQRHTPPQQPNQQQGQNPQHQQGQMAGQQQQAQQHNPHPAPSPVHQVPHTGQPTPATHLAHQPHQQQQILYQPAPQLPHPPQTLQHTPQSPQGIHPPPPPQQAHSQAPPHQMQPVPVATHTGNAHITTVTPVHPQPYPHTQPPMHSQMMMVPQQQGHGHAHSPSAAGHTGAAGVVASNPPTQISAPYLQVDGKVMVLTEGNAYYSAAPRLGSPGPPHTQPPPVHGTYPQNN
ncbi:ataxin-2-like protein isoform X3 [Ptychodera flava]|uniref:ataxin-2-like protein isoform X3 n=1 Tax=Ptychodera flava TaxID=63121 RepID=UPI003969CFE9